MKVNTVLLNDLMKSLQKEAYTPPAPPAPPMDPNAVTAGAPPAAAPMPMDPSGAAAPSGMGGGAPMPQDPNAAGSLPQIDPTTGLPVGMPTSPDGSMGPPPADPNAAGGGGSPQGTPVTVTLEDLQTILQQAIDAGKDSGGSPDKGGDKNSGHLEQRVDALEGMLGTVLQSLGMAPPAAGEEPVGPEGDVGGPEDTETINEVPMAQPAQAGAPNMPSALSEGLTDEAAEAVQLPKTAEERVDFIKAQHHKRGEDILKKLRSFGVIR